MDPCRTTLYGARRLLGQRSGFDLHYTAKIRKHPHPEPWHTAPLPGREFDFSFFCQCSSRGAIRHALMLCAMPLRPSEHFGKPVSFELRRATTPLPPPVFQVPSTVSTDLFSSCFCGLLLRWYRCLDMSSHVNIRSTWSSPKKSAVNPLCQDMLKCIARCCEFGKSNPGDDCSRDTNPPRRPTSANNDDDDFKAQRIPPVSATLAAREVPTEKVETDSGSKLDSQVGISALT